MIKILVYCPIKADATSFYRGWGPLQHLADVNDQISLIDIAGSNSEISWSVIRQGHLLFMQRPSTSTEIRIMEIAQATGTPIWIDYDDDYFNIPESNPRHDLYANPHRVEQIKRAIQLADVITVSTPGLRDSIIKNTGKPIEAFHVIPNALDDSIFKLEPPDSTERKVLLWRGGDTHDADLEPYVDKMALLYNEFPEYTWAFMGNAPRSFLEKVDNKRILLYPWEDVFIYFDLLMELRPKLTIVPWENTPFNEGKSNCSWIESTAAGAATVFPEWSTEFQPGMIGYHDPESFYKAIIVGLNESQAYTATSLKTIADFTLWSLNHKRNEIALELVMSRLDKKLTHRNPKYDELVKPFTDLEFYNFATEKTWTQDAENYRDGHYKTAEALIDRFKPNSVVEIGCGPGATLERLLDCRIPQVKGFEPNPHFKAYFDKRNPHYADHFINESFANAVLSGTFDLAVSIEVFEHIPAAECDALIEKMSHHFKYFYFTSTPYRSSKRYDAAWGHINIRTFELWQKTFESRGWKYLDNPQLAARWDMVFKSTNVNLSV